MKKRWKIFAIICSVLAGLGIILCIAGFALGINDSEVRDALRRGIGIFSHRRDIETTGSETRHGEAGQTAYSGVSEIEMNVTQVEAEVIRTDDAGEIRVETDVDERLKFRQYLDGERLVLETTANNVRVKNGGTIRVYVPENVQFSEAEFSAGDGTLRLEGIAAQELDLEIGLGLLTASDFTAGELTTSCGAGKMELSGSVSRDVDIECGMGDTSLTLAGKESDYNYELEVGIGTVEIGGEKFSGLAVEKTINNHADKTMDIECGVGSVAVNWRE